jgi:PAS domain S-box-containing protein
MFKLLPDTPDVRSRIDVLYMVTREFNAGLDIDQVLNRVLAATVASVGAADASLFLFDQNGELDNVFLISGFKRQERDPEILNAIHKKGLIAWVKEHREGVLISNTHTDKRWYSNTNNADLSKVGCAVSVPIQNSDQLIGVLTITANEPDYFDESNLAMLSIIADQAAFAIANARLFKAEQHRRSVANTLASIAHTINSTLDLNEVLQLILEQLTLVIDFDSCSIFLYDKENDALVARAAHGFEQGVKQNALEMVLPMHKGLPNYRVITEKRPVVIADVSTEPGWMKRSPAQKIRAWMGVPLIAQDRVIGMLTIDSHQPNKYNQNSLDDVMAFADQAATAVANAQAVSRLQDTEASYAALFENNSDMIVITNYHGIILNANRRARWMLWQGQTDLLGNSLAIIDERLPHYLAEHKEMLKSWQETSVELEVLTARREKMALEFKIRQVHYDGNDCVQWVGRDVSARREAEKLRQDMVKMLIHDLRSPLGNLISTIDLLPRLIGPADDNQTLKEVLAIAGRNSREIKDMIDSMLDVSRHEQGNQIPLKRYEVQLDTIFAAVKEQVTPRADAKQMKLIFNLLPDLPLLWVDESMLRRVLVNLVDNAIKYTPAKGCITVNAGRKAETLHLVVSDNGPGINPKDHALIFDRFARVDSSANAPAGVGLGLAFCKMAVEAHGGSITIESEGVPGQGSTFHVHIPLEQPHYNRPTD